VPIRLATHVTSRRTGAEPRRRSIGRRSLARTPLVGCRTSRHCICAACDAAGELLKSPPTIIGKSAGSSPITSNVTSISSVCTRARRDVESSGLARESGHGPNGSDGTGVLEHVRPRTRSTARDVECLCSVAVLHPGALRLAACCRSGRAELDDRVSADAQPGEPVLLLAPGSS
jgi:hypothetical protein